MHLTPSLLATLLSISLPLTTALPDPYLQETTLYTRSALPEIVDDFKFDPRSAYFDDEFDFSLDARDADAYADADAWLDDFMIADIYDRAQVDWHNPNAYSSAKKQGAKASMTTHASNWGDQNSHSHVTVHDGWHSSGNRPDGKKGDSKSHMTVVPHDGQGNKGKTHHLYQDGTHSHLRRALLRRLTAGEMGVGW